MPRKASTSKTTLLQYNNDCTVQLPFFLLFYQVVFTRTPNSTQIPKHLHYFNCHSLTKPRLLHVTVYKRLSQETAS